MSDDENGCGVPTEPNPTPTLNETVMPTTSNKETRPMKASDLVLAAIQHLNDTRGSTLKDIIDYVRREHKYDNNKLQRCVLTALKRGVKCGKINDDNGHYTLQSCYKDDTLTLPELTETVGDSCITPKKKRSRSRKKSRGCSRTRKSHGRKRARSRRRCSRRKSRSRCARKIRKSRSKCSRKRRMKIPKCKAVSKKRKSCPRKPSRKRSKSRKDKMPCCGKQPRRCSQDEY